MTESDPLDATGVRVLGSLIEKASTTPDNYPLTLNALTVACNQTTNRDPVFEVDQATVLAALDDLARRQLVRAVHRSDSRVRRYRHLMAETLNLHPAESAVMCVLMLRGPQTAGEIRVRTTRLFEFNDPAHVEITLESLMTLATPLVTRLPRRPGHKEVRYAHLLSGEPLAETADAAAADTGSAKTETAATAAPGPQYVQSATRVDRIGALEHEVASLRSEVAQLRSVIDEFRRQFE